MSADVIHLNARRPRQPADPTRAAIRAFLNDAVYVNHGDSVSVTVPLERLDLLMAAAVDGGGAG